MTERFLTKVNYTSGTKIPEIFIDEDDKANPPTTQSGRLIDLIYYAIEKDADEASHNSNASSVSSQSSNSVLSPGGKTPRVKVSRRSKAMKMLCMAFTCGQPAP
jgi:hypothetical protein